MILLIGGIGETVDVILLIGGIGCGGVPKVVRLKPFW